MCGTNLVEHPINHAQGEKAEKETKQEGSAANFPVLISQIFSSSVKVIGLYKEEI